MAVSTYDIKYVTFVATASGIHLWLTKFGVMRLDQLVSIHVGHVVGWEPYDLLVHGPRRVSRVGYVL